LSLVGSFLVFRIFRDLLSASEKETEKPSAGTKYDKKYLSDGVTLGMIYRKTYAFTGIPEKLRSSLLWRI
jgi:hypothetical protein